jgi:hypothetical protein
MLSGTLACLYAFFALWPVLYKEGMDNHRTMQRICYVMAVTGIIIALYWLATREVSGIPFLLIGLDFLGMARYSEHIPMDVGAAALSAMAMVIGVLMYTRIKQPNSQP